MTDWIFRAGAFPSGAGAQVGVQGGNLGLRKRLLPRFCQVAIFVHLFPT